MKIFESFDDFVNSGLNESNRVTLKRKYTQNHPEITAGKNARIRNKIIEAIADGKFTREEFDNLLKEMTKDNARWMRRNAKYFNVSEEGVSLSKFGKRILNRALLNENELNESTRSHVGVIKKNGEIESVYVHYDGYPDEEYGVGRTLKNHYNDPKKINKLMSLGKYGISTLDMDVDGAPGHSWGKPVDGQTVFYGRDRGQKKNVMVAKGRTSRLEDYLEDILNDVEYVYLWDEAKGQWLYTGTKIGKSELKLLEGSEESYGVRLARKILEENRIKAGLGEKYEINDEDHENPEGYPPPAGKSDDLDEQYEINDEDHENPEGYPPPAGKSDDLDEKKNIIKSDDDFKMYAFSVLQKAFGDEFDEDKAQETVDGILSKVDGDYGAAIGMLTSSLGESLNTQLSEGKMSELNNMAVDAGSLDKFMKDAYKEYGWKKNQETDEFLADFYKEATL